jgi:hypothetical protein
LLFFPKLLIQVPHIEIFRPFFIILMLVSIAYGLRWLYRQGMKKARRK